jgi:hypothetical protein
MAVGVAGTTGLSVPTTLYTNTQSAKFILMALLQSTQVVLVNFYADWCRFSQMLKPIYKQTAQLIGTSLNARLAQLDCENPSQCCLSTSHCRCSNQSCHHDLSTRASLQVHRTKRTRTASASIPPSRSSAMARYRSLLTCYYILSLTHRLIDSLSIHLFIRGIRAYMSCWRVPCSTPCYARPSAPSTEVQERPVPWRHSSRSC